MKNSFWINPLLILVFLSILLTGCPPPGDTEPTVTTSSKITITADKVEAGGEVTDDGGSTVTDRGVCWNNAPGPTITNNKASNGTGTGTFVSIIMGLSPGVTYYVRAYATNSEGTTYGSEFSFTIPAVQSIITTTAVTAITSTTAISGGNITADGGATVTAKGVCWSTTTNPAITNNPIPGGTGTGSFTSSITGLSPGTKYYVRAYATNSAGTAYGSEISFTTLAIPPSVTTTAASSITSISAISGGNVTADGGGAVTARGVCWNTSTGPTISNSKTSDGTGIGIFNSSLTTLTANTTYYVKAYATNSAGTAYGTEISFKTLGNPPTVTTANVSSIGTTTATSGGNVTSDGGAAVTARGVCWSTSTNPTIANSKTTDSGTIGIFISSITGLTAGTTYYVRAYATNSAGVAYGGTQSFTTSSIIFVQIPAGTFTMGSPIGEFNRFDDELQHQVTLSAFRMSKFEITNAQYAAFLNAKSIGSNGLYAAGTYPKQPLIYASSGGRDWGLHYTVGQWVPVAGYENHPVIYVTWYGAAEFATYFGGRLPTEEEWEYACRAGTSTPFNTGTCLTNLQANYDWTNPYSLTFNSTCTNTITTSPGKTQAVGTYSANAYGLNDMHGNVCEWCSNWYEISYPLNIFRIIRGGSYGVDAKFCRSAYRWYEIPDLIFPVGFRIVQIP